MYILHICTVLYTRVVVYIIKVEVVLVSSTIHVYIHSRCYHLNFGVFLCAAFQCSRVTVTKECLWQACLL